MKLLRAGKKKCTVRMGTATVAAPDIVMSDGRMNIPVRILRVDNSRNLDELTDQDARDEGFEKREELLADLNKYYPWAKSDDPITVIYFELIESQPKLF